MPKSSKNRGLLIIDNWDDYSYKTQFLLIMFDSSGNEHEIGNVKIGYKEQSQGYTNIKISQAFEKLDDNFFSLGQDVSFYKNISILPEPLLKNILEGLRDVVYDTGILAEVKAENVFNTSLLRFVSFNSIENQFKRVLNGGDVLTEFDFSYKRLKMDNSLDIELSFKVVPESTPPSNIHVLIGRNGVGKTTLLNDMIKICLDQKSESNAKMYNLEKNGFLDRLVDLDSSYFSSIVSISFSAFDPFIPPHNRDRSSRIGYSYIGLKNNNPESNRTLKDRKELEDNFISVISNCLSQKVKTDLWLKSIKILESDNNFSEMELERLINIDESERLHRLQQLFGKMSSGHSIVLYSISCIVNIIEEKTLVLLDEPESYLHPPLLSAFIRALSQLLIYRNGVAIIATHSPVVLQEVPRSCVSIIRRTRSVSKVDRPEIETFGENVGILTREVFGLEVVNSGFYNMLLEEVEAGKSYEEILEEYRGQIGSEGKALLRVMTLGDNIHD